LKVIALNYTFDGLNEFRSKFRDGLPPACLLSLAEITSV